MQSSVLGNTFNNNEQFRHHVVRDRWLELTHPSHLQLPGRHVYTTAVSLL